MRSEGPVSTKGFDLTKTRQIRAQYHFRPSPHGRLIWDVRKLILLSKGLPVIELALTEIDELNENWWFQDDEVPTVKAIIAHYELMQQADLTYPILLCADGRLMDGMHRVARALHEGRDTILAKRFKVTPPHDFFDVPADELPYDDDTT